MKLSLIICTYMRPVPCRTLLQSVELQTVYPDEIIIVDGSTDNRTAEMLRQQAFRNLAYYKVPDESRGLTRQRNYGLARVAANTDIVAFLDDDTVLDARYFEELTGTYKQFPLALGVGGYIDNEVNWQKWADEKPVRIDEYFYDGWKRKDGSRFVIRKRLGLDADMPPGFLPDFSHGRSIGFLPPSGKTYEVRQLMGGVSSFRKKVFDIFSFSEYFEGYGLYEDADFTLRLSKQGPLYINTAAHLAHYHDGGGRPNKFSYGKMVVRNGWYVWRVAHPEPSFKARFKWHAITLLLAGLRLGNFFTHKFDKQALTESIGRFYAWAALFFNKPYIDREN